MIILIRYSCIVIFLTIIFRCDYGNSSIGDNSFSLKDYDRNQRTVYENNLACNSSIFEKVYEFEISHKNISEKNIYKFSLEIRNYYGIIYQGNYENILICKVPYCIGNNFDTLSFLIIDEEEERCFSFSTKNEPRFLYQKQVSVYAKLYAIGNSLTLEEM